MFRIRIRIHRIHKFLGLAAPDPDLLVRGMDPVPDPAPDPNQDPSTSKIVRKTLIPTVLRLLFDFLSLKNYVNVPSISNKQKNL